MWNTITANITSIKTQDIASHILSGDIGQTFIAQDVWKYLVENYGFVHYGCITAIINKLWNEGAIENTGNKQRTIYNKLATEYTLLPPTP